GVCEIPLGIAPEVAHAAADFVQAEAVVLDFTRTGNRDVKAYSEARQETMRLIAALGKGRPSRSWPEGRPPNMNQDDRHPGSDADGCRVYQSMSSRSLHYCE